MMGRLHLCCVPGRIHESSCKVTPEGGLQQERLHELIQLLNISFRRHWF